MKTGVNTSPWGRVMTEALALFHFPTILNLSEETAFIYRSGEWWIFQAISHLCCAEHTSVDICHSLWSKKKVGWTRKEWIKEQETNERKNTEISVFLRITILPISTVCVWRFPGIGFIHEFGGSFRSFFVLIVDLHLSDCFRRSPLIHPVL